MSQEMVQYWFDFMVEHGTPQRILKEMEKNE